MNVSDSPYTPPTTMTPTRGNEWMKTDTVAMSKTALGLSLVYYGIVLSLLAFILAFAVVLFPPALSISMVGLVIASVLMIVGPLFCLSVPAETDAKGLVVGAVTLQGIYLALSVLPALRVDLSRFGSFALLFGLMSSICFVLFMRKLATFIGREDLASRARTILVLGVVVLLAAIGGMVSVPASGLMNGMVILLGAVILGLVLFIKYANLVNALRKALK